MPSNTTYSPIKQTDLDSKFLNFNGSGVAATVTLNTSTTIDLKMTDDNIINGVTLIVQNATFFDYVKMEVVDVDGVLAPPGTVLKKFADRWYMATDIQTQHTPKIEYPAKIFANLYLRLTYYSTASSGNQPNVAVNYHLHKCLA